MSREEAEFAVEMAAAEGWNPGIHDGELFYEADPEGFFIAEIAGKPLAVLLLLHMMILLVFLAFMWLNLNSARTGIGMKLTEKCLEHLGERNIGLDGVVENEKKYQKVMKFKSCLQQPAL